MILQILHRNLRGDTLASQSFMCIWTAAENCQQAAEHHALRLRSWRSQHQTQYLTHSNQINPWPSPLPDPQAEHAEAPQPSQFLVAYGPDGKAVGTITRDRLLVMYRSYEQTSTNRGGTSLDASCCRQPDAKVQRWQTDRRLSGPDEQLLGYTRIPHDSHQTRILLKQKLQQRELPAP